MSLSKSFNFDLTKFSASISLSEDTAEALKNILQQQGKKEFILRIFAQDLGIPGIRYGMTLDERIRANDIIIEIHGIRFIIDPTSRELLRGATIEHTIENGKPKFKIHNPNEKTKTCAYKQGTNQESSSPE